MNNADTKLVPPVVTAGGCLKRLGDVNDAAWSRQAVVTAVKGIKE